MKTPLILLTAGLVLLSPALAVEPQKPLVNLTVKRQVIDSDHDLRGRQGSSARKTITLRVEIVNASASPVAECELSGDALITRARNERETVVKESLGLLKLPAMKPHEKLTLSLGKIQLSESEWRNRKFEEKLEEWQVVCTQGPTRIGSAVSSDRFETLLKEVVAAPKDDGPAGRQRKQPRRIGD